MFLLVLFIYLAITVFCFTVIALKMICEDFHTKYIKKPKHVDRYTYNFGRRSLGFIYLIAQLPIINIIYFTLVVMDFVKSKKGKIILFDITLCLLWIVFIIFQWYYRVDEPSETILALLNWPIGYVVGHCWKNFE